MRAAGRQKTGIAIILALGWACHGAPLAKPPLAAPEYHVKAGYLLLFTRYVVWPNSAFPDAASKLAICVTEPDPFGSVMDETFRGARAGGREMEVRRIKALDKAMGCHALFIPGDLPFSAAEWFRSLAHHPILTVTESKFAMEEGAAINFTMDGNTLRFDVNLPAAEKAGLRLAAPLLVSARKVSRASGDKGRAWRK